MSRRINLSAAKNVSSSFPGDTEGGVDSGSIHALPQKQKRCDPIKRICISRLDSSSFTSTPLVVETSVLDMTTLAIDALRQNDGQIDQITRIFFPPFFLTRIKKESEYLISFWWVCSCVPKCRSSSSRAPLDSSPIPRIPVPLRKVVRRRRSGSAASPSCVRNTTQNASRYYYCYSNPPLFRIAQTETVI